MPIDDLYADSTSQYLSGSNQVNVPVPQTSPSTSIGSIARAAGRGFGQGALQFGGALADTTAGLSQFYVDPDSAAGAAMNPEAQAAQDKRINDALAKQRAGHLFESRAGAAAYDLADTLKPDPTNTTATDQIVQGAVSALTQIVPSTLLFGPAGGAVAGGASIGMSRAEDLKRQGVDVGTRTAVGAAEGALSGAGAVLPVAGSTLARTAGLVAVGGPGLGIAQGVAEKAILRNANYDHLADQIDPLDPTSLAASTLVAGVFAGARAVSTARSAKAAAGAAEAVPKTASVDIPLTDMSIDARKALRYSAPQLDTYAAQAAQAAGVPPEMLLFIKNRGEQSNSNQVSPKGAKGVMQFTDPTFAKFGKGDPTDPINSIDAAAAYSKDLLQRYDGDVRAALTEYNGGVKQAQAVHAGGAPTDPETIAYLRKYDRFAATQQINTVKFDATPEQIDAALASHGRNIVDEANILPETDVAGMAAHQDAFDTAARQMNDGSFPQVADKIPDGVAAPSSYAEFERGIADGAAQDVAIASAPSGPVFGPRNFDQEIPSAVFRIDKASSLDGNRLFNIALQHQGEDVGYANVKETRDHVQLRAVGIDDQGARGKGIALQAYRDLADYALAKGKPFVSDVEVSKDAQRVYEALRRRGYVVERNPSATDAGDGTLTARKPIFKITGAPAEQAAEHPVKRTTVESTAAPERSAAATAPQPSAEPAPVSPVEANVREAALADPAIPVHLDSSDPTMAEHNGTIQSALEVIDNEHAATLDDAKLFSVAANCFIGTEF